MIDMPTNLGFWNAAQAAPGTTAVIDAAGRSITFGQLHGRSNQLVQGLRELGLQPGDAIAYLSENRGEIFELFMAAAQAGWFITPINTHLAPAEVAYILEDCGAKACFLSARCAHLGLQPAVHAIGDRANRAVLDLMAKTAELRELRPRIEHAQHLRAADVARFAELGVVASMQRLCWW